MRRDVALALTGLLALGGCATSGASASGPAEGRAQVASALPDFELSTVDGERVRLSSHLGRDVVLMSFWETWCEPCKTELPHLDRIYREKRDAGFVVLAISMDEPSTVMQVTPYVRERGFAFPVLLDTDGQAANLYNPHRTAPYTVIIGRDGTIVSEVAGFEASSIGALEQQISGLLSTSGS